LTTHFVLARKKIDMCIVAKKSLEYSGMLVCVRNGTTRQVAVDGAEKTFWVNVLCNAGACPIESFSMTYEELGLNFSPTFDASLLPRGDG
jgi:hypothetical protein